MGRASPCRRSLIIQSHFSGDERILSCRGGEKSRGGKNGNKRSGSDRPCRGPVTDAAKYLLALPDTGADGTVLAGSVVIRFRGDIESGKQNGSKRYQYHDACGDP
jgi:hypothetical protein